MLRRGVKFAPFVLAGSLFLPTTSGVLREAQAQDAAQGETPLLLGGPSSATEQQAPVDPSLPSGEIRWHTPRPTLAPHSGTSCATGRPLCVHGPEAARDGALQALTRAYDRLRWGLGLSAPARDATLGGGDELDWYLDDSQPLTSHAEPIPSRSFDRATSFCVGGQGVVERDAALCVTEALTRVHSPALAAHPRRALATHLWWGEADEAETTELDERSLRAFQENPEQSVLSGPLSPRSEGAGLFFQFLDRRSGIPSGAPPGRVALATVALAATRTDPEALRWASEPDVADVLRSSLGYDRGRVARFYDDFARARVPHDGTWLLSGVVPVAPRLAWEVKLSTFPRHLALPRPMAPTGSVYIEVDLDRKLSTGVLALRATCETPVSYVWSIERLGARGELLSTLRIPFQERRAVTEQRIENLETTKRLRITGTNLGGVDLGHPFDPDHGPHESHSCFIYLAEL